MTASSKPDPLSARFTGDPAPRSPTVSRSGEGGVGDAVERLLDEVIRPEARLDPLLGSEGLRGKVAIVTGASSGIGRAVALELAASGVDIAFCYLDRPGHADREDAEAVATQLRQMEVRCFHRPCDVRDPIEIEDFVGEAYEELGGIHILVNNAGIHDDAALWRMSDDQWTAVLDTNLSGAFYFLRSVAPYLREQEYGKVVNIASVHGLRSEFGLANYCTSKAGLIGLTHSAAVELGPKNVNVNAVAPGYIRTTRLTEGVTPEVLDRAREQSVLGRLGDPRDVAHVVLFLCSEAARHITGAVIPVDGGHLL
jgi:3-oxoacyl-[acyl-carrier protein] reductase